MSVYDEKPFNCAICQSPFRDELESLWKNPKVKRMQLYNKYIGSLPIKQTFGNWYAMMRRHVNEKHGKANQIIVKFNNDSELANPQHTVESFAQKLLELGMVKVQSMNPGDVAIKDVIQAQRLLIEKDKLKMGQDTMMLQMAKLFAPPGIVEGEEVSDATSRFIEGDGTQPESGK